MPACRSQPLTRWDQIRPVVLTAESRRNHNGSNSDEDGECQQDRAHSGHDTRDYHQIHGLASAAIRCEQTQEVKMFDLFFFNSYQGTLVRSTSMPREIREFSGLGQG